jgi:hypothetical protein
LTGNHKRYFSDGFQTQTSPAIQAKAVFQAQTATGKLNAEIIPTTPKGDTAHTFYVVDVQSALLIRAIDEKDPLQNHRYQSFPELHHILLVMISHFVRNHFPKALCFT